MQWSTAVRNDMKKETIRNCWGTRSLELPYNCDNTAPHVEVSADKINAIQHFFERAFPFSCSCIPFAELQNRESYMEYTQVYFENYIVSKTYTAGGLPADFDEAKVDTIYYARTLVINLPQSHR